MPLANFETITAQPSQVGAAADDEGVPLGLMGTSSALSVADIGVKVEALDDSD